MEEKQEYSNHVRWYPLVHFVLAPVFFLNFVWQAGRLYMEPSWDRAESVVVAVALMLLMLAARLQALKAQDRVIHLEENLRYRSLPDGELAAAAIKLPSAQIVALRFASDEELPDLLRRTLAGELKTSKEIKLAIKNWRGDYSRV